MTVPIEYCCKKLVQFFAQHEKVPSDRRLRNVIRHIHEKMLSQELDESCMKLIEP
jgi:hypothetical protein